MLLEDSILRISGTDRYEMSGYALRQTAEGTELVVGITPKSYGPPFLLPAVDLQNIDSSSFSLSLRLRLAVYDTLVPNSEWRVDIGVGTEQTAAIELYKRLGRTGLFLAPHASFTRRSVNGYQDGDFVAEYRAKRTGAGFDIGYTTGLRSEVRLGYDAVDARIRRRIGPPTLPEATGSENVASLRFEFDDQNSPIVPSRGVRVRAALRYLLRHAGHRRAPRARSCERTRTFRRARLPPRGSNGSERVTACFSVAVPARRSSRNRGSSSSGWGDRSAWAR